MAGATCRCKMHDMSTKLDTDRAFPNVRAPLRHSPYPYQYNLKSFAILSLPPSISPSVLDSSSEHISISHVCRAHYIVASLAITFVSTNTFSSSPSQFLTLIELHGKAWLQQCFICLMGRTYRSSPRSAASLFIRKT